MILSLIDNILEKFTVPHILILIGSLIIFIGLIAICVGLYKKYVKDLKHNILNSDFTHYLKIDLLNKKIYIFSKKELKDSKELSLQDFLSQFDEDNQKILNRWLLGQLNKKKFEPSFKELTNYSKKKKNVTKDIFVCRKIDFETHIIYVDYYCSTSYNKRNPNQQYIKVDYEIERCFFKLKKSSITCIGTIFFFSKKSDIPSVTSDPIYKQQIIDIILKYSSKNHLITLLKQDEIGIIALNEKEDSEQRYQMLEALKDDLCSYFSINNFTDQSFNIVIYKNTGDKINFNECIKKVRSLQSYLLDNYQYEPTISFYYDDGEYICKNKIAYNDKLKKAIAKDEFNLVITPFVYARKSSIAFYKMSLNPIDTSLFNQKLADKEETFNLQLKQDYINLFFKKIDTAYSSITKNISNTILVDCSLKTINSFINNEIKLDSKYKIIFSIKNDELEAQTNDDYLEILKGVKANGYKLCLNMNTISNPKESVLKLIDYALFQEKTINKTPSDENFFLQANLFKLFDQNKIIIIAEDIDTWQTLETLISDKVSVFSSKCFELSSDLTAYVSKKISSKIDTIYKKYY